MNRYSDAMTAADLFDRFPHLRLPGPEIVAEMVVGAFTGRPGPLRLGRSGSVVAFAADGLSWDLIRSRCAGADALVAYRSTFPSTSLVSWLAAVGLLPGDHQVPGPVLSDQPGRVSNLISNNITGWDGVTGTAPTCRTKRHRPGLFERLCQAGVTSNVLVGDFLGINESWIKLLCRGGRRVDPGTALDGLRLEPGKLLDATLADLASVPASDRPSLTWAYLNFDDRIHRTGYDDAIVAAVDRIVQYAAEVAGNGTTVLLHSDHGHIRNEIPDAYAAAWESVDNADECECPAGGAGRVRWLYPRPGRARQVADRLRAAFGPDVAVFLRTDPAWWDFAAAAGNSSLTSDTVGDVIAVALTERFPVPDPQYVFEHGSICADEMRTGVAVWNGG